MASEVSHGRSSVFRRLAAMLFLIEAVVLCGVSLLLFRYAGIQEAADRETVQESLEQGVRRLENQIESVYRMTDNLLNDTRLARIAYHMYPDDYERSRLVLGILDSLRNISDLNPVVEDICVSFPMENLDLSISNQYNKWAEYELPAESEMTLLNYLYIDGNVMKVRLSYPAAVGNVDVLPDYACEVTFSEDFLSSSLTMFGSGENAGAVLFLTAKSSEIIPIVESDTDEGIANQLIQQLISENQTLVTAHTVELDSKEYTLFTRSSHDYPFTLVAYRQATISKNMFNTLLQIAAVILGSSLCFLLLIWHTNRRVARPIYRLMAAFEEVKKGGLSTRIHHDRKDEFYFIYDAFNKMVAHTGQLVSDIAEQHKLLQNAELIQLQAQIDPHFLYNSFNIIKYMADGEEYEQITEFVSTLARYYRFINKETRQSIPLSAEMEHTKAYLDIQQMRFADRIQVTVDSLPEEIKDYLVPKLILQPLVENCYNHGLKNKLSGGYIRISFTLSGRRFYISVEDNGGEMDQQKLEKLRMSVRDIRDESVAHALANIRRRLELAYGDANMLSLSIGEMGGLCVTLAFDRDKKPEMRL